MVAVKLRMYDLQRRYVETLATQVYDAGEHTLRFDGSTLASGVYMLRLTSGSYSQTQKLMLLK
jgi:hypothetical protein